MNDQAPTRLLLPEAIEQASRYRISGDQVRDAIRRSPGEPGYLRAFQPTGKGGTIYVDAADLHRWLNTPAANVTPSFRLASGEVQGGGVLQPEAQVYGRPEAYDPDELDEDGFPLGSSRPAFAPEVRLTTRKAEREAAAHRRALEDSDPIPTVDGL